MGACYNSRSFKPMSTDKLKKQWSEYIEDLLHEYGHDSYNGTLSTTRGLSITSKKFIKREDADKYILDTAEKWGSAIACQVLTVTKPFSETATGKKLNTKLSGIAFSDPKKQKLVIKYKEKERQYLEKKAQLKSAKYGWLIGGWCAE